MSQGCGNIIGIANIDGIWRFRARVLSVFGC